MMLLGDFPRVKLVKLPTPLQYAARLSEDLGIDLYFKRDDAMELAFGGNKIRKLEYLLGDALKKNCDTVITTGALALLKPRLTVAAARKIGLKPVLILRTTGPRKVKGNLLLDVLLEADVRIFDVEAEKIPEIMEKVARELEEEGRKPYIIPGGGACPIGALGYLNGSVELMHQLNELCVKPDYIVHSTGSGGTQTGLTLGMKALNSGVKVIGISCGGSRERISGRVKELADETSKMLGLPFTLQDEDIIVYDEYTFGGYGIVTGEVLEVMKKVAKMEGIILDPLYTAKAMIGLIDLVKKGIIEKGSTVIFIHTGGTPLVFQYEEDLWKYGLTVKWP